MAPPTPPSPPPPSDPPPAASCPACASQKQENVRLRRENARLRHRLTTACRTAETHGQRLQRHIFAQQIRLQKAHHARRTADMLNMQQSLFEDEIDALHAHSRQLSAALDAQHAQRAAATHKTEAFVRAVGERMRGLQEGLADAQKAAALVGTAEDAEKRRKAFIIEGLSQEVDLLTKCASPSSSPSVADLHSRADNLPQH